MALVIRMDSPLPRTSVTPHNHRVACIKIPIPDPCIIHSIVRCKLLNAEVVDHALDVLVRHVEKGLWQIYTQIIRIASIIKNVRMR